MSSLNFEPGSTVSHFRLEKKLGEGGMGAVYLAEDLTLSRKIAIKFMSRSLISKEAKPEVREALEVRFIREAKSAAAINHPNVCQIYEANFESDDWYIAMEFIRGKDLVDLFEDKERFTPSEVADTCRQVASGMKYAWNHYKIVHRDIKPRNIMVTEDGMVKIVDLGLAKPITQAGEETDLPDVTMAGTAIGTPQYMAPEQATGDTNIDYMVDIYALGATLYEMCTGEKAFNERTPTMIYMAQMGKKYKQIREYRTDVPDALIQLIEDMLEPNREDRIGSYDEILDRIRNMSKATQSIFDEDDFGDEPMGLTQIAGSVFKDYSEDHLILDRYRVMKKVGQSRAGVVYKCIDKETGNECAVKSLAPEREFSAKDLPFVRDNFKRLISKADTNLVTVLDVVESPTTGEIFVIMERLEGINFREYVHLMYTKSSTLSMKSLVPVLRKVARAIDKLNDSMGYPHNDLKPESIFIPTDCDEVKLLDYGITQRALATTTTTIGGNEYKVPLESTDYMAPEKWEHGVISKQADQYAFALVVYEILGRRLPFWTNDPGHDPDTSTRSPTKLERARFEKMKKQVLEETVPTITTMDKNVNAVLMTALSKHPEERFPNSQTFVSRLAKAAGVREKSTLAPLLAGVAILGIVVLGIFFYLRMQDLNACKEATDKYNARLRDVPVGTLSKALLKEYIEKAVGMKGEADGLKAAGQLKKAIVKYKAAELEMANGISDAQAKKERLLKLADDLNVTLLQDVETLRAKVLATMLIKDELSQIESALKKASGITENDLRLDALKACKSSLVLAAKDYATSMGNLSETAEDARNIAVGLKDKIKKNDLTTTTTKGQVILAKVQTAFNAADATHNDADKEKVLTCWRTFKSTVKTAEEELTALRESYRTKAVAAEAKYKHLVNELKRNYGKMANTPIAKLESYKKSADTLYIGGNYVEALKKWETAVKMIMTTTASVKDQALKLATEIDDLRKKINDPKLRVLKAPLGGKELLIDVNITIKKAVEQEGVGDLAGARDSWVKATELLAEAEKVLLSRITVEKKNRKTRGLTIRTTRANYNDRYLAIKSNTLSPGLLQSVPDPEKLMRTVPDGANDKHSLDIIEKADTALKVAEDLLKKRILKEEEETRKRAFAVIAAFDKKIDAISKNTFAKDLIKQAIRHRNAAKMAHEKKSYDSVLVSMTSANQALKTAELELADIMKNELRRKEIIEKRLLANLAALKKEFTEGMAHLEKKAMAKDLINPIALKRDQAVAIQNTGTKEDALKAWEDATDTLKDAETEVMIREKNKADREKALVRKLERECQSSQKIYADRRTELVKSPFATVKIELADKVAAQAKSTAKSGKHKEGLDLWKQALGALDDLQSDLQADTKTQAQTLKAEVEAMRKKADSWENWDPIIGEKLVEYDVSMAMARERLDRNDYLAAGTQLIKCKDVLTKIEAFVMNTFVAKPGTNFILGKVGMEFIWIKSMKLWVGTFEVTNRQYRLFKPSHTSRKHEGMSLNEDEQPVCWINYFDAAAYCQWLTRSAKELKILPDEYAFRLPNKKEWTTYASCGNAARKYPWGDMWPPKSGNYANQEMFPDGWNLKGYRDDFPVTCVVNKSGKSEWGLYGVSGNLWEWTSDKKGKDYAVFGGAWESSDSRLLQIDLGGQNHTDPQKDYDNVGFRVLLIPKTK